MLNLCYLMDYKDDCRNSLIIALMMVTMKGTQDTTHASTVSSAVPIFLWPMTSAWIHFCIPVVIGSCYCVLSYATMQDLLRWRSSTKGYFVLILIKNIKKIASSLATDVDFTDQRKERRSTVIIKSQYQKSINLLHYFIYSLIFAYC